MEANEIDLTKALELLSMFVETARNLRKEMIASNTVWTDQCHGILAVLDEYERSVKGITYNKAFTQP